MNARGFIEINTSVLEHTTGGADANPFVTHMDALGEDFYLRISHELPLKRLIGAGYEKVYDIGQRFRNENYSDEHLPEHVAMEWYWAYANWQDGIQMMEEMYKYVLEQTFGKLQFKLGDFEVDMSGKWEVWDYATTINQRYGIDIFTTEMAELQRIMRENGLEVEKADNRSRVIDKLWKNIRCRAVFFIAHSAACRYGNGGVCDEAVEGKSTLYRRGYYWYCGGLDAFDAAQAGGGRSENVVQEFRGRRACSGTYRTGFVA